MSQSNVVVTGPNAIEGTYKNIVLKSGIGFEEQTREGYCIYHVKWNYDLGGAIVDIPANVVISMEGGVISNGTLVGHNTQIIYDVPVDKAFVNVELEGTWIDDDDKQDARISELERISGNRAESTVLPTHMGRVTLKPNIAKRSNYWFVYPYTYTKYGHEETSNILVYFNDNKYYLPRRYADTTPVALVAAAQDIVGEIPFSAGANIEDVATALDLQSGQYLSYDDRTKVITMPDSSTVDANTIVNDNWPLKNYTETDANLLTQQMISKSNTIYVIQYDYELATDITIPDNCMLEFDGGSLSNGTVVGNNTGIEAGLVKIFNIDTTLNGIWNVAEAHPEWFGAKCDGVNDDTQSLIKTIESFKDSVISLSARKTLLVDNMEIEEGVVINGNNSILSFKEDCSLFIDYKSDTVQNVSELTSDGYVVSITVSDGSSFRERTIVKLYSDDVVNHTPFKCSQYFAIESINGNVLTCRGSMQFSFNTNPKVVSLSNKTCKINSLNIKGERTQQNDRGLITIRGGVFHNINDVTIDSRTAHGFCFIGCYGYNIKAKTIYQQFVQSPIVLIGMLVTDIASSNFVVDIQSETSQQFTTIYTGDDTAESIGMTQYGLIKNSVVGYAIDGHANEYRCCYIGNVISANASIGIGVRGQECHYKGIISHSHNIGAYIYTDSNNAGGNTIYISDSEFLDVKDGISVSAADYPITIVLKGCRIVASGDAVNTGANCNLIIENCYVEGNINSSGTIKVTNSVLKNCKLSKTSFLEVYNSEVEIKTESYFTQAKIVNSIITTTDSDYSRLRTLSAGASIEICDCVVFTKSSMFVEVNKNTCSIKLSKCVIYIQPLSSHKSTFFPVKVNSGTGTEVQFVNTYIYNNETVNLSTAFVYGSAFGVISNSIFKDGSKGYILQNSDSNIILENKEYSISSGISRPAVNLPIGYMFFDTTLGKPIYWNGTIWVDATGTTV